VHPAGAVTTAA